VDFKDIFASGNLFPVGRRELCWRHVFEGAMRSDVVVVGAPDFDRLSGVVQRRKPVRIQALLAKLNVEAFNIGILGGFSGVAKPQLDAAPLGPGQKSPAGKVGSVVRGSQYVQSEKNDIAK
jgi:hypothetical protein